MDLIKKYHQFTICICNYKKKFTLTICKYDEDDEDSVFEES